MTTSLPSTDQMRESTLSFQSLQDDACNAARTIYEKELNALVVPISQHIDSAHENAIRWLNYYSLNICDTLVKVKYFGFRFNESYTKLCVLAEDLKDPSKMELFNETLANLRSDTEDQKNMVDVCNNALKKYTEDVAADNRGFLEDLAALQIQIEADESDLQVLTQEAQELENKRHLSGKQGRVLKDLLEQISSERSAPECLYQLFDLVKSFADNSQILFSSCFSLTQLWDDVSDDFDELIDSEEFIESEEDDPFLIMDMLKAMKLNWDDLENLLS